MSQLTPEQLERLKMLFVDCCRVGKEVGLDNLRLAAVLAAFASRLAGPDSDNSPLERYINSPDGDNPKARPN